MAITIVAWGPKIPNLTRAMIYSVCKTYAQYQGQGRFLV